MKRILALDLGSTSAFAAGSEWSDYTSGHGVFTGNRPEKLSAFRAWLSNTVTEFLPDAVIYERPFARGQAATRMLWGMAGQAEAVAFEHGLPIVDIDPQSIKKWATGKGNADKTLMTKTAIERFKYSRTNEHEADAICLLHFAHEKVQFEGQL